MKWDSLIRALVLIKIGQELGCGGRFTQTVHDTIELIIFCVTVAQ
jgi:hypothetical protein